MLGDGECIEADQVILFASGYQTTQRQSRTYLLAGNWPKTLGPVWGFCILKVDSEMLDAPTNVQNFYVLAGGVIYSRRLSRPLASLINARLVARRF